MKAGACDWAGGGKGEPERLEGGRERGGEKDREEEVGGDWREAMPWRNRKFYGISQMGIA